MTEPVEQLVKAMEKRGLKVFYDKNYQASLWGLDVDERLSQIYSNDAKFAVTVSVKIYFHGQISYQKTVANKNAAKKRHDFKRVLAMERLH